MSAHDVNARTGAPTAEDNEIRRATHRTIAQVGEDLERWSYNTAVAHCMEQVNLSCVTSRQAGGPQADVLDEAFDALLLLMAPMTPHVAAELWEHRHGRRIGRARPSRGPPSTLSSSGPRP